MILDVSTLRVDVTRLDGAVVLSLVGELDLATVPALSEAVASTVAAQLTSLIFDLKLLTFVDVVGLRALAHAQQKVRATHTEFGLRSVTDLTRRVIRLTGFEALESCLTRSDD